MRSWPAHLLYGEWLRRENRRVNAREQFRAAYAMLTAMGIEGFAERARRELLATGETVRRRTVETVDDLTGQEAQIARLASDGLTNPEVSTQLFLSPCTVGWHLRKVFAKLGISPCRRLRGRCPALARVALPAWPGLCLRPGGPPGRRRICLDLSQLAAGVVTADGGVVRASAGGQPSPAPLLR